LLPFGGTKAVIGKWTPWKSSDDDFRNAFPFRPTMPGFPAVDRFHPQPSRGGRRRNNFHDAQFTPFLLQGVEGTCADDVASKQRSRRGVSLSWAAAKTMEAETWGNGADTAGDRCS